MMNSVVRSFINDLGSPIKEKFSTRPLIEFLEFLGIQGLTFHIMMLREIGQN